MSFPPSFPGNHPFLHNPPSLFPSPLPLSQPSGSGPPPKPKELQPDAALFKMQLHFGIERMYVTMRDGILGNLEGHFGSVAALQVRRQCSDADEEAPNAHHR